MRSNHYSLNASMYRKNLVRSPGCSCNPNVIQDIDHILWACPKFDLYRRPLLKSFSKALNCPPLFCSIQFLSNPTLRRVSPIFRFLKFCNIKV